MKVGMIAFACQDYAVALTNALARHCDVDFYCGEYELQRRDPSLLEALDDGIRAERFGHFRVRDARNLSDYSRLCQTLRERRYDVLHFQTPSPPWMALSWRELHDVPLVLTVHDPYQHTGLSAVQLFYQDMMQKICVRRAQKIIVHGRLLKSHFLERYPDKAETDVVVLPHGDLAIAKRWNDNGLTGEPSEKNILFFGAARPNKGLRHLLEAESLLPARLDRYRVVVAGDCGDFSRFDRYIRPGAHLDVTNRFISNQELPRFFREAAVVVVPYTSATQSGIVALAYTFGKPVVATRVGALPEVVIDGVTGLLVPPGDARSLADAIATLLSDDALREKMGQNALNYCREHLSWDAIAQRTVEVYAELSGTGVSPVALREKQETPADDGLVEPLGTIAALPTSTADDSVHSSRNPRRTIRDWSREVMGALLRFSGASRFLRRFARSHWATILVYHDPGPDVFDRHMAYLASRYTFIPLRRLVDAIEAQDWSEIPANPLVVTMDDGYRGNYRLLDSIRRWKLRPTIFLCSDIVNTRRHYWWNAGHESPEELKRLPPEDAMDILRSSTGFEPDKEYPERQSLNLKEIREMMAYVDFGSHTRIHPILPNCSDEACREEIIESKRRLENLLGIPILDFAYPNGDYGKREMQLVAESPYQSARTMDVGWNDSHDDRLRLHAMAVDDDASINVLCAQTCGCFGYLHRWTVGRILNTVRRFIETS